jgi:hypothetical protein
MKVHAMRTPMEELKERVGVCADHALTLRDALCKQAILNDAVILGMGTIEAHARSMSLEMWIAQWGRAQDDLKRVD